MVFARYGVHLPYLEVRRMIDARSREAGARGVGPYFTVCRIAMTHIERLALLG